MPIYFEVKEPNYFHPRSRGHGLGSTLSQMEGIIPAIETAHAFAILDVRKFSPEEVIVFNCSGRGDKDLDTYIDHFKL